ncbi:b(0,+)-type amino acid transporter 1 [Planococcus citri]|uniref:b(0,+)-type amino acid transporter 1 n=1 Tax=Planococcus citri TaxID=170843 RepID=UPI0031F96AAF
MRNKKRSDQDGNFSHKDSIRDRMERVCSIKNDSIHLKRRVGLYSGVALIVGTMIGSGIFVSPSGLLVRTGSIGLSLIVWTACGFISLLGALAYAELGTMNPSSGAEYVYFMDAFGSFAAYMFSWTSALILKPSQIAIICLSFAEYVVEYFTTGCEISDFSVKVISVITILTLLYINCYSVQLATSVQNIFTAGKLIAIGLIICGGTFELLSGSTKNLTGIFRNSTTSYGDIATAFYSGLWAYDGWNNLNYATEEIKNPSVNIPRAIFISIPLVTLCYVLINISYLTVMSPQEMISSEAVAVTFGKRVLGMMAWLMSFTVVISTFGSANGTVFAAGRLLFAAGREGHMLEVLSHVHIRSLTPTPGLIFTAIIAIIMVLSGTIHSLIDFFSFTAWIFYGGAMIALLVMRYTKPDIRRPYKVPIIIPILVLVVSLYLTIAPIIDKPQIEYLYTIFFLIIGVIFYVPFVKHQYTPAFIKPLSMYLQILLQVTPTDIPIHEIEIPI